MGALLAVARDQHYDCSSMVKKLRAMLQAAEEQARLLKKQSGFLSQLAAKTVPKPLNCLSLRLTIEYSKTGRDMRVFPHAEKLEDNSLYHYALFSDNVLAAATVVNSTVVNAKVGGGGGVGQASRFPEFRAQFVVPPFDSVRY